MQPWPAQGAVVLAALRRVAALLVGVMAAGLLGCAPAAPANERWLDSAQADTRRSGLDYLSPALRDLQIDDTQSPAMLWVAEGERRFAAHCQRCHTTEGLRSAAARHPTWDASAQSPVTLGQRIQHCHARQLKAAPPDAHSDALLAYEAYLAFIARGQRIQAPSDPRLRPWLAEGQGLWRTRLGAIALSCADCHDGLAGRRLAGSTIPQGHPTGYPVYRLEWQGLGSLERRLRGCLTGVRAEPFAPGAREWVSLELALKARAAGMVLEGPGVRP